VWVCSPSAFLLGRSLTLLSLAFLVVSCVVVPIRLSAPSLSHLRGGCHSAPLAPCRYRHGWWCCCRRSYCAPGCRSFCSPACGKVISARKIKRTNNSRVGPGGDTSRPRHLPPLWSPPSPSFWCRLAAALVTVAALVSSWWWRFFLSLLNLASPSWHCGSRSLFVNNR
jgi:hypothetical protein